MTALESRSELRVPAEEIERRYCLLRERMVEEQLDAILVCGNQYAGFEGAIGRASCRERVYACV